MNAAEFAFQSKNTFRFNPLKPWRIVLDTTIRQREYAAEERSPTGSMPFQELTTGPHRLRRRHLWQQRRSIHGAHAERYLLA